MTGFGATGKKGSGAVKQVRANTGGQRKLKAQMAANSLAWHNAATQAEKDALHAQNVALAKQLGGSVVFDPASGKWSGAAGGYHAPAAPAYTAKYQARLDQTVDKALNREPFSYDPDQDPAYRQYEAAYTRAGKRAMQDTLGEVSARTGGLASSYAGTAAQQTYDGYIAGLAGEIPTLRALAYEMYRDAGEDLRADVELLAGLEDREYARYEDRLGQYNKDRAFTYGQYRDSVDDGQSQDELTYERERDEAEDAAAAEEKAYRRALEKARTLAASGDFSGYEAVGYSPEEIERMRLYFITKRR